MSKELYQNMPCEPKKSLYYAQITIFATISLPERKKNFYKNAFSLLKLSMRLIFMYILISA